MKITKKWLENRVSLLELDNRELVKKNKELQGELNYKKESALIKMMEVMAQHSECLTRMACAAKNY